MARVKRLIATQSVLFVCDIQELFRPLIYRSSTVIDRALLLTKVSRSLNIPVIVTRQYPKVFGATCSEIQHELENFEDQALITDVSKTKFSMRSRNFSMTNSLVGIRQSCVELRHMSVYCRQLWTCSKRTEKCLSSAMQLFPQNHTIEQWQ